jgi:hypothetical protein
MHGAAKADSVRNPDLVLHLLKFVDEAFDHGQALVAECRTSGIYAERGMEFDVVFLPTARGMSQQLARKSGSTRLINGRARVDVSNGQIIPFRPTVQLRDDRHL